MIYNFFIPAYCFWLQQEYTFEKKMNNLYIGHNLSIKNNRNNIIIQNFPINQFNPSSFDFIYIDNIMFVKNKKEFCTDIIRILKPNGKIMYNEYNYNHNYINEINCLSDDQKNKFFPYLYDHHSFLHHFQYIKKFQKNNINTIFLKKKIIKIK
jgi:hypothetical protein